MLNTLRVPFRTVDILDDYEIVKVIFNWPTIPQVYGQFIWWLRRTEPECTKGRITADGGVALALKLSFCI